MDTGLQGRLRVSSYAVNGNIIAVTERFKTSKNRNYKALWQ